MALSGTAAPAGGNYTGFSYAPVLNASGQVAFVASTSVSGSSGIFAGTPGSPLTTAALTGIAATPAIAHDRYQRGDYYRSGYDDRGYDNRGYDNRNYDGRYDQRGGGRDYDRDGD